ncbi:hypothetical protein [Marinimicrobium sp. ABcell2]|uniref:hypothetical protein n=1 Tax=Marinimicrobium sp. ABcell2 TaxID=3069751 RepID=UPI0027B682ED|nr:hypothetical protein [Marinimicrobium sp. ABcell2]MDQ2077350.1 hypothetical protein [Marinimicrobium sp. ABcell2]
MSKTVFTNQEIVDQLKILLGHETNASLMRELEVSKQSLHQFSQQTGITINNKIATALIREIKSLK